MTGPLLEKARALVAAVDGIRHGVHDCGGHVEVSVSPAEWYAVDRASVELEEALEAEIVSPIPMRLLCPACGALHVDEGEFASKPHHTHACQECGNVWRPAIVPTVGVRFLSGFRNPLGSP